MKKIFFPLLFLFCLSGIDLQGQSNANDIIGYYLVVDPFNGEQSQIQIYFASNGKYEAIVTWVENPEKKKFLGLLFLKDLIFNEKEKEWQNGIITYPGKKGTFKTYMKFEPDGKLKVRGYWGVSLLGKTLYWNRESGKRE